MSTGSEGRFETPGQGIEVLAALLSNRRNVARSFHAQHLASAAGTIREMPRSCRAERLEKALFDVDFPANVRPTPVFQEASSPARTHVSSSSHAFSARKI